MEIACLAGIGIIVEQIGMEIASLVGIGIIVEQIGVQILCDESIIFSMIMCHAIRNDF